MAETKRGPGRPPGSKNKTTSEKNTSAGKSKSKSKGDSKAKAKAQEIQAKKQANKRVIDEIWAINRVLEILELDAIESDAEICEEATLEEILKVLLDYACENGICEDSVVYRDLFDTKIMGQLTARPSEIIM